MVLRRGARVDVYRNRLELIRNHTERLLLPGIQAHLRRQARQLHTGLFFSDESSNALELASVSVSGIDSRLTATLNIDPSSVFRLPIPDIGAQQHWPAFLLHPESDTGILLRVWAPGLRYGIENTSELGTDVWGFRANGLPLLQGTREYAAIIETMGERITQVNESTRQTIMRMLADGVASGAGGRTLAARIEAIVPAIQGRISSPARARVIARTEAAFASAQSSVTTYELAGVGFVDIVDGPGCGWASHNGSPVAMGLRVTVGQYQQTPLSHPNCRRGALPVVD